MIRFYVMSPGGATLEEDGYDSIEEANARAAELSARGVPCIVDAYEPGDPAEIPPRPKTLLDRVVEHQRRKQRLRAAGVSIR